jgi:hypothetical protein
MSNLLQGPTIDFASSVGHIRTGVGYYFFWSVCGRRYSKAKLTNIVDELDI